jgi:hypothetical protein
MAKPTDLEENVYVLSDWKPGKEDGDVSGSVLYFKPGFGWYSGHWNHPHMDGTTHWTYLPKDPAPAETLEARRNAAFKTWLNSFPSEARIEELPVSLLRLGWNAGWDRAYNR